MYLYIYIMIHIHKQYQFIPIKSALISSTLYLRSLLQKEIKKSIKNVKAEQLISQTN